MGGGKGGVGKTGVASSIAVALARSGFQCVAVDADFGAANLHIVLGVPEPRYGRKVDQRVTGTRAAEKRVRENEDGAAVDVENLLLFRCGGLVKGAKAAESGVVHQQVEMLFGEPRRASLEPLSRREIGNHPLMVLRLQLVDELTKASFVSCDSDAAVAGVRELLHEGPPQSFARAGDESSTARPIRA